MTAVAGLACPFCCFYYCSNYYRAVRGGGGGGGDYRGHVLRGATSRGLCDDDVFYFFLQKQKIGAELHIHLEEGTYHKRLFRGPNTNDMKK
jgi:hypothetical protein